MPHYSNNKNKLPLDLQKGILCSLLIVLDRAPQSKCMPLSASLTVQSTLDRTKYSGESMPFSKQECLNSQASKLHNSNITDILETH